MAVENAFSTFNNNSTIVDVFMENPKKYGTALVLAQEILREDSALSSKDREIVAMFTSSLNGCKYCTGSHFVFAKSLDADEEELNKIINQDYEGHKLKSILDLVKKLTLTPSQLTKSDYQNVFDAGFSEAELKDAISVCAIFNFYNRIVEGHGIVQVNYAEWEFVGKQISEFGYDRRYAV